MYTFYCIIFRVKIYTRINIEFSSRFHIDRFSRFEIFSQNTRRYRVSYCQCYRRTRLDPTKILVEFDGLYGTGHRLRSTVLFEFGNHRNGRTDTSYVDALRRGYRMSDRRDNRGQRNSIEKGNVDLNIYLNSFKYWQ